MGWICDKIYRVSFITMDGKSEKKDFKEEHEAINHAKHIHKTVKNIYAISVVKIIEETIPWR